MCRSGLELKVGLLGERFVGRLLTSQSEGRQFESRVAGILGVTRGSSALPFSALERLESRTNLAIETAKTCGLTSEMVSFFTSCLIRFWIFDTPACLGFPRSDTVESQFKAVKGRLLTDSMTATRAVCWTHFEGLKQVPNKRREFGQNKRKILETGPKTYPFCDRKVSNGQISSDTWRAVQSFGSDLEGIVVVVVVAGVRLMWWMLQL